MIEKIFQYLLQFAVLLLFWGLGYGVSFLLGGAMPGSVMGMVLLFLALSTGLIKESYVKDASSVLLQNMMLYFLPATVGVMVAWRIASEHILAILLSAIVSTLLVMGVVGIVQQKLGNK